MNFREYKELGGYQYKGYQYDAEARLRKKMIKVGDCFAIYFGSSYDVGNNLNVMKLNLNELNQIKLSIKKINLEKEWKGVFRGSIPVLFKYLGGNKAIELLTGAMFFIAFSSEQDKLIHREYGMEVDYLFENQEYYQEYIGSPFVISGSQIEFEMPDNNLKAYYYRLVEQKNLKKLMQELIQKKRIEFVENYQKIVQTRIYSIASIENMAYDLDRKLEDKNSLKKERKK